MTAAYTTAFDLSAALERTGGDRLLLREIAAIFLEESPLLLDQIRAAIKTGDARTLERAAHSLKGSVSTFGAQAVVDAAAGLETLGRAADFTHARAGLADLQRELELFEPELEAFQP